MRPWISLLPKQDLSKTRENLMWQSRTGALQVTTSPASCKTSYSAIGDTTLCKVDLARGGRVGNVRKVLFPPEALNSKQPAGRQPSSFIIPSQSVRLGRPPPAHRSSPHLVAAGRLWAAKAVDLQARMVKPPFVAAKKGKERGEIYAQSFAASNPTLFLSLNFKGITGHNRTFRL